jgi:hypothetical protein
MKTAQKNWFALTALSTALAATLTACGGGGGSSASSNSTATASGHAISGTVASGAPIVGKVTVIDSLGATRTVDIQASGAYSVDVSGLTGPFLFRAVGTVAGRTVSLASAAASSDGGSTINITPFTDLLVANIVGMAVENYLANHSTAPALTSSTLEAASTALTQRLAPILSAAGLSTSFDLLHASFAADHTGFDKLMDAVTVAVDADTNIATIVDKLDTGTALLTDNLTTTTDTTQATAVSTTTLAAVDDLTAIEGVLSSISSYFTSSVPSASNVPAGLQALFTSDVLQDGADLSGLLSDQMLLSADNVGLKFANPVIFGQSDSGNKLKVRVSVSTTAGGTSEIVIGFKKVNGSWLFWGNRALGDVSVKSTNGRGYYNGAFHYNRYVEVWVDSARNDVASIVVTGPGFGNDYGSITGVKLEPSTNNATVNFEVVNPDGTHQTTSLVPACDEVSADLACVDTSAMGTNGRYTVHYYDANGVELTPTGGGTDVKEVPRPPVSNADAQTYAARWFADFTSYTPASITGLTNGVTLSASWTVPTDSAYSVVDLGFQADNNAVHFQADLQATQTSVNFGTWSGAAPSTANIWLYVEGPEGLHFFTSRPYPQ